MKPNLFIVGAPKCGTTAWAQYLGSHPEIYFSRIKEPHYFSTDFPNWRWVRDEEEYLALFPNDLEQKILGEASTWYLQSTEAPKRIRKFNPDSRIIILVRPQEEALPSLHNHMLFNENECIADFEQAWRLSGKRDSRNIGKRCREPRFLDYAAAGAFSQHVERYFAEFPAEQIRVFDFRDWSANPRETYAEVCRFLGVADDGRTDFPKVNEAHHSRTAWLRKLYRMPPKPLIAVSRALKAVTGQKSLGIAERLRDLDRRRGKATRVSDALKQEIREFYAAENAALERRIWRPAGKVPAREL